jgi:hypothetical protein
MTMRASYACIPTLWVTLLVPACSIGPAGPAISIEKLSGDEQAGFPGTTLPLPFVVGLTDGRGAPISGLTITFDPSAGSMNPTSTVTDTQGRAATFLTLPFQGANVTVRIRAAAKGATTVEFTAVSRWTRHIEPVP